MWEWMKLQLFGSVTFTSKMICSIVVWIMLIVLKRYISRVMQKVEEDQGKYYRIRKICNVLCYIIYAIVLLIIWYKSSTAILTFLGVFSAGIAISVKDIFINMFGGLYILLAKPFKVGERIEIAKQVGDVIDISLLHFTMLEVGNRITEEQSTGRILHMPNLSVFTEPLANYEKGFKYIWHEITIKLDLQSDLEVAKTLFDEILNKQSSDCMEEAKLQIETASKQYLICYNNLTPIIYTQVKEHAICLSLRYLCEPRKVRMTENVIWEEILKRVQGCEEIHLI